MNLQAVSAANCGEHQFRALGCKVTPTLTRHRFLLNKGDVMSGSRSTAQVKLGLVGKRRRGVNHCVRAKVLNIGTI
jgi:hypothetical protein